MSHIFDALQRAEAEQSGNELSLTRQLLQMAQSGAPPLIEVTEERIVHALPETHVPGVTELLNPFEAFGSLPIVLPPNSRLVSFTEKDSLAAEKFRFLAVRLRQLQQTRPLKKLLITSTIPEEGKSMLAANLACTLARRKEKKTLLLDGDLRRPTVAKQLGLGHVSGLSECLQDDAKLTASVYRLDALGLWVLPAGSATQNPLELMQSGRLSPVMDQLTEWFDWIVIDSPPVLPFADTIIWARMSDGILLATRQGKTEKKQLQRGLEALEESKLVGAIVNSSTNTAHSDYYHRYQPIAPSREREKAAGRSKVVKSKLP
ncbi:MAG TPA: CpsD/CapB family tyrosine-protein kinase [Terriglobales bacterium]|nr:CpsD/CapB family tyrosine-protein kinase [Terriglobales bacterium]